MTTHNHRVTLGVAALSIAALLAGCTQPSAAQPTLTPTPTVTQTPTPTGAPTLAPGEIPTQEPVPQPTDQAEALDSATQAFQRYVELENEFNKQDAPSMEFWSDYADPNGPMWLFWADLVQKGEGFPFFAPESKPATIKRVNGADSYATFLDQQGGEFELAHLRICEDQTGYLPIDGSKVDSPPILRQATLRWDSASGKWLVVNAPYLLDETTGENLTC